MTTLKCMLTLVTALVLSIAGHAQFQMDSKRVLLGSKIFSAFSPVVRKELKITDAQYKKLQDAFEGQVEAEGERVMVRITSDTPMEDMTAAAMKVLDTEQVKRLNEIWLQNIGAAAILDPAIAKELGVTADQRQKSEALADKIADELMSLMQDGPNPDSMKKAQAVRKEAGKKFEALLTAEQLKKLEVMKGKPMIRDKAADDSRQGREVSWGTRIRVPRGLQLRRNRRATTAPRPTKRTNADTGSGTVAKMRISSTTLNVLNWKSSRLRSAEIWNDSTVGDSSDPRPTTPPGYVTPGAPKTSVRSSVADRTATPTIGFANSRYPT